MSGLVRSEFLKTFYLALCVHRPCVGLQKQTHPLVYSQFLVQYVKHVNVDGHSSIP